MTEGSLVEVSAWWAVGAVVLLLGLAGFAATLEGILGARGRPVLVGARTPITETARLLRQGRRRVLGSDVLLWRVGVAAPVVVACLMVAVVPLDRWTLADLAVGVVWFNAMDVIVWAAIWLAGWGPNAAYSLVGGYRFLAQALAYELPLMFALTTPAVAAGSLRIADVVADQDPVWNVVWMPVAFGVYCLAVAGFSVWGPLSPAAGADIAGGVLAELSGPDRLLLLVGRYALLAAGAAFAVPLFLGGGAGPLLPGWVWVLAKACLLLGALVAVRRVLPALRPERFMELGWMVLLPLVLVQLFVVASLAVGKG